MDSMLCDICHKTIATVHLTEIVNDKIAEMHICSTCAKNKTEEIKDQLNISDFLGGMSGPGSAIEKEDVSLKCSSCGLSYADFKKKGRLGCGNCYLSFKKMLLPLLKKIHGSTHHAGKKIPQKLASGMPEAKTTDLKGRLERAVQLEEYEEAARLRDEIKNLENKISS
ncbi:MAG: UvrB/UvrC motif-containing protein [Candidatus Omnitrophica bacterium]|nr:UvrB/UvrC motif-containing protein [Candidatus Omnitrophota bacterium]